MTCKIYYIAEPDTKEAKQFFEDHHEEFPYMASDLSFMPEGYLMSGEQFAKTDMSVTVHRIPEYILEDYDTVDDLVTDYWDGEIMWGRERFIALP